MGKEVLTFSIPQNSRKWGHPMWPINFCFQAQESFFSKLMPALVAGVFGAAFVFLMNWLEKRHSETKRRKTSGNYAMLILIQHINELINWEKLLAEWRTEENKQHGWLNLKTLIHASELPILHVEDLAWMLETDHRNLVGEFLSARDGVRTVHECISRRNKIKEATGDKLQKYFKEHPKKMSEDGVFDSDALNDALGRGDIIELHDSFDCLMDASQATLLQNAHLMKKFHAALKSIWRHSKFIRFDSFESILSENGLQLEDQTILPKKSESKNDEGAPHSSSAENVYRIYVN